MEKQFGNGLSDEALEKESINLRQYWHIILERRWLVLAAFLVVIIVTLVYLFSSTSIYSSTTRLQIDRETENSLRMDSFVVDGSREVDYLQTKYKNLQSRSLMELVMKETIENATILEAIRDGKNTLESIVSESKLSEKIVIERLEQIRRAGFFEDQLL